MRTGLDIEAERDGTGSLAAHPEELRKVEGATEEGGMMQPSLSRSETKDAASRENCAWRE